MTYNHILVRFGELALKGKNRTYFEKKLMQNIKLSLKEFPSIKVMRTFGRIIVQFDDVYRDQVIEKLKTVFGIHSFSLALVVDNDIEAIKRGALDVLKDHADAKTFKISAKRVNKSFPLTSDQLNHEIGAHVLRNRKPIKVDVRQPDVEIRIEVREKNTYITSGVYEGAGGLPVGTSGKVLLLLSGGIDSPVAGYLALKRGATLEAVHFHSPPYTNERAKQKVIDLAKTLTQYGANITLHLVPFTDLQKHIYENVPSPYQLTIMRRMMLRISAKIAERRNILALATGESLGQVSSQTLESMNTINEVTNLPILRPLVTMDKLEVIEIAKKIGTYETSILPYEDCCTIFLPPDSATKPKREQANEYERALDMEKYIEAAVENTEEMVITPNMREDVDIESLF